MKKKFMIFVSVIICFNLSAKDMFDYAEKLYAEQDYYRAISAYKEYIFFNSASKKTIKAEYKIAMSYLKAGKFEEAMLGFKKFEKWPDFEYVGLFGQALVYTGLADYTSSDMLLMDNLDKLKNIT